jgi:hypothetical protein
MHFELILLIHEFQTSIYIKHSHVDRFILTDAFYEFGEQIFLLRTHTIFGRKIGRGGFGRVFYGRIQDGMEVAFKVLKKHRNKETKNSQQRYI